MQHDQTPERKAETRYGVISRQRGRTWFSELAWASNNAPPTVLKITEVTGIEDIANNGKKWGGLMANKGASAAKDALKSLQNGDHCLVKLSLVAAAGGQGPDRIAEIHTATTLDDGSNEISAVNEAIERKHQEAPRPDHSYARHEQKASDTLTLDVADLGAQRLADGTIGIRATLLIDGKRICLIDMTTKGEITADEWSQGYGPDDLSAIDAYIAATSPPRKNGEVLDSLAAQVIDLISMQVAVNSYREASANTVFFHAEEDGYPVILSIVIPEGGTRAGAWEAMSKARDDTVPLDLMTEEEAAMTWMTLTR